MAVTDAVIAYDISDDDARARAAALLSHHGVRLQRSVYTIRIEHHDLDVLVEQIRGFIDENRDVVHVFRQCAACHRGIIELGQAPSDLRVECWIV